MESAKVVTILPKRLFWVCDKYPPDPGRNDYIFCVDNVLVYQPFNNDFGPVDISKIHRYCKKLTSLLSNPGLAGLKLYHYTGTSPIKKTNSVLMMCSYLMVVMMKSPQEALSYFSRVYFPEFRDASRDAPSYFCSIFQCLKALQRSILLGWYSPETFDPDQYEFYSCRCNGDINWIIPHKLAAFSDPTGQNFDKIACNLKELGINVVIRLNHRTYAADKLRKLGIKHFDLFFHDGACPSEELLRKFLLLCENESGAIAIHCKSGLGRAGTLIACYAMKHFEFPAPEIIAWTRMARPGSILGPQQMFLIEIEDTCYKWGEAHKKSMSGSSIFGGRNLEDKIPLRRKSFDLKNRENFRQEREKGLESFLLSAKARTESIEKKNIEDRDAISPPISYRKKKNEYKRTFMNLSSCFFYKENISITLASSCRNRQKINESL